MLIEIESYYGNYIVEGKNYSKTKITEMCKDMISSNNYTAKEFTKKFCNKYEYKILNDNLNKKVDLVIDLDTEMIYVPKYSKEN